MKLISTGHKNISRKKRASDISRVTITCSSLKILSGSDLFCRRLPLMSAASSNPGPVVWLTACGHGDELCGIVIIHELFKKIRECLLRGSIHAFPMMNPMGFETVSRHITVSGEDLNRSFPGDAKGSPGKRIGGQILKTITATSPDLVLDLHNDWIQSIPYALIDLNTGRLNKSVYKKTLSFAGQTGFAVITDKEELPGSLSYNLLLKNIPSLTLELGEPYVVNEKNVVFGVGAIWNILAGLKMITPVGNHISYPLPSAYGTGKPLRYSDKPYSSKSGIVRFLVKPGDEIKKGRPFARIINAFGKHQETVRAIHDGIVLGHSNSSAVFPGMPIMAFGVEETAVKHDAKKESL